MLENGLMPFIATFNDERTMESIALLIKKCVSEEMNPWVDMYGQLLKYLI